MSKTVKVKKKAYKNSNQVRIYLGANVLQTLEEKALERGLKPNALAQLIISDTMLTTNIDIKVSLDPIAIEKLKKKASERGLELHTYVQVLLSTHATGKGISISE